MSCGPMHQWSESHVKTCCETRFGNPASISIIGDSGGYVTSFGIVRFCRGLQFRGGVRRETVYMRGKVEYCYHECTINL